MSSDVVIVGGGVIGLSIAYHLACAGTAVTVLDAGWPGQASTAAAGMLAPLAEAAGTGPFLDFALASCRLYPDFTARVRDESGIDPELFGPGTLRVAWTEHEEQELFQTLAWQGRTGLSLEMLDGEAVEKLEPALARNVRMAVRSADERQVSPRRLLPALETACARRGVQICHGAAVSGIIARGRSVQAVQTQSGSMACGAAIFAGGAWSAETTNPLGFHAPVSPVRGQILSLGPFSPDFLSLHHTVWTHGAYLVPRADGRIVVGATEERVGFLAETTQAGLASLRAAATRLAPRLANAPLESGWAGLRPVSADGLPLLGRVPGWENALIAAGHGRNGILLAPATGAAMTNLLLHDVLPPRAFAPDRFRHPQVSPAALEKPCAPLL